MHHVFFWVSVNNDVARQAIQRLRSGRTVLHIAHRGLAIENADVVKDMPVVVVET